MLLQAPSRGSLLLALGHQKVTRTLALHRTAGLASGQESAVVRPEGRCLGSVASSAAGAQKGWLSSQPPSLELGVSVQHFCPPVTLSAWLE